MSKNFVFDFENIIVRRIPGTHSNGKRMSDHRVLKFRFNISCNKRGSGYWKLNSTYLENETYRAKIRKLFLKFIVIPHYEAITKWELMKTKVNDFSIDFLQKFSAFFEKEN